MHHKYFDRGGSRVHSGGGWLDGYESGYNHFLREYEKRELLCSMEDQKEFTEISNTIYKSKINESKEKFKNILEGRKFVKVPRRNTNIRK